MKEKILLTSFDEIRLAVKLGKLVYIDLAPGHAAPIRETKYENGRYLIRTLEGWMPAPQEAYYYEAN